MATAFSPEALLKRRIRAHFTKLGFTKASDGTLKLPGIDKHDVRRLHSGQRAERLNSGADFLSRALPKTLPHFADGMEVDPTRIRLRLIRVYSKTAEADLFRVAALTWSVPVSPGFGRRLRYLVWDDHHNRIAGIIALGDPVYNLSVRDDLIGWDVRDRSERLVNLLDAYVLGAVPPYNMLLGGKAVACLVRSKEIFNDFKRTYGGTVGVISGKAKRASLLVVTTTSSMGRSSIYNRLRLDGTMYFSPIGYTIGWGHFHITDQLFTELREYLRLAKHPYADQHEFGEGPNWRLRTIRAALTEIGISEAGTSARHKARGLHLPVREQLARNSANGERQARPIRPSDGHRNLGTRTGALDGASRQTTRRLSRVAEVGHRRSDPRLDDSF